MSARYALIGGVFHAAGGVDNIAPFLILINAINLAHALVVGNKPARRKA